MIAAPLNLIGECKKVVGGLLATGVNYTAGMLLHTNGSNTWEHTAIVDGMTSEVGILIEDMDATATGKTAQIMTEGEANLNKIIFPAGQTFNNIKGDLQKRGIYLTNWRVVA